MPGSSDKCPFCDEIFFGRQKFVRCKLCSVRTHVSCLCQKPVEQASLLNSASTYTCRGGCKLQCSRCCNFIQKDKASLRCISCELQFHPSCQNVKNEEELKIYKEKNNFKCMDCIKNRTRIGDNTPLRAPGSTLLSSSSLEQTDGNKLQDSADETDSEVVEDETANIKHARQPSGNDLELLLKRAIKAGVEDIRASLEAQVATITHELQLFKKENAELKNLVRLLVSKIVGSSAGTSGTSVTENISQNLTITDLSAHEAGKKEKHKKPKKNNKKSANSQNKGMPLVDSVSVQNNNVNANSDGDDVQAVHVGESRLNNDSKHSECKQKLMWTEVVASSRRKDKTSKNSLRTVSESASAEKNKQPKKIRKKVPMLGSCDSGRGLVRPRMRALFVSRFNTSVEVKDVETLLGDLKLTSLRCTQLKAKYPGYNSFHVQVADIEFEKINNPEVWPMGVIVAPFYGPLRKDLEYAGNDANKKNESPLGAGLPEIRDG